MLMFRFVTANSMHSQVTATLYAICVCRSTLLQCFEKVWFTLECRDEMLRLSPDASVVNLEI